MHHTTAISPSVDSTIVLRVLRALAQHPGLTRAELATRADTSRPTVSAALRMLEDRGFLEQRVEADERNIGRPPMRVFLAGSAASSVGLEITRTELHAGMFNIAGHVLSQVRAPVHDFDDASSLLDDAAMLVRKLLDRHLRATAYVLGVGVAIAAPIDHEGHVVQDVSPTRWTRVNLAQELSERLGLPVSVENDANAAALAEHRFGAGRSCTDLLYLRLSAGVGAGLILGNRIYRGASGIAGEIGHLTIDPRGALCGCGGRGCLETLTSPLVLEQQLRTVRRAPVEDGWMSDGDRHVRRLLADAGDAVGSAIATAINLLDPGRVVIGGHLAEAGVVFFDAIDAAIVRDAIPSAAARARVVPGSLGAHAPILGAATALISRELEVLVGG
ncbi:ROK family transcriptional regulator [Solirubrobacter taibaiensis]|nr:ROK family transcriptional regulator [Solirubrobacter taibaiensis]